MKGPAFLNETVGRVPSGVPVEIPSVEMCLVEDGYEMKGAL